LRTRTSLARRTSWWLSGVLPAFAFIPAGQEEL
jgi:hypothetical protein